MNNYVLGIETIEDVFLYIHESPYLKNSIDPTKKTKNYINIFKEINLDEVMSKFNKASSKWTFNKSNVNDLGSYFDVYAEHKNSQSPEYMLNYKLKKEHTPVDFMTYIMKNSINVDSSIAMTLFMLYCVWKYVGDEKFNRLHPFFIIKSISLTMNPLIKLLFKTKNYGHMKPCDIDQQKKELETLPVGSYCYMRGSMGWYNFITSRNRYNNKIDLNQQGENLFYLGNQKFMSFGNRKHKGNSVSFETHDFDTLLDNLMVNGKKKLLDSVDDHRHLYRRYLVYYLDSNSKDLDNITINNYIQKAFEEGREMDDPKINIIYNPFDVMGINGYSDMYLDLDVFNINNLDQMLEDQVHYKSLVDGVLKAYRRGMFNIQDLNMISTALDSLDKDFLMFGLIDYQRHQYFNLLGWDDNIPLLKDSGLISFPPTNLGNIRDEPRNLSNVEFYQWDNNKIE